MASQRTRALYVLGPDAVGVSLAHAASHLERLAWTYHPSMKMSWSVVVVRGPGAHEASAASSQSQLAALQGVVGEGRSLADVAAMERLQGSSTPVLERAYELALVEASAARADPAAVRRLRASATATVATTLDFEAFCGSHCARACGFEGEPNPLRFEYHTQRVLEDVWSVVRPTREARNEAPAAAAAGRYNLGDALDARRAEALVLTRRRGPFLANFANDRFWEVTGWPCKSKRGMNLNFLQGADTSADAKRRLHEALARLRDASAPGEVTASLRNYTNDGEAFRVHLTVTPCDDAALLVGRVERGPDDPAMPETAAFRPLETAADAAKRRKTAEPDEALAEAFVREALDDDAAAVVVTEARHPFKIVYVNDAWARLCEFDKAECVGKSNQLIQGPETDFELCRRKMAELLAPPHTCAMTQVNYKQSGEPFRNRVTIRPVLDAAREPRYFVAKLDQEDPPPGLALGGAGVVLQPPAAAAA